MYIYSRIYIRKYARLYVSNTRKLTRTNCEYRILTADLQIGDFLATHVHFCPELGVMKTASTESLRAFIDASMIFIIGSTFIYKRVTPVPHISDAREYLQQYNINGRARAGAIANAERELSPYTCSRTAHNRDTSAYARLHNLGELHPAINSERSLSRVKWPCMHYFEDIFNDVYRSYD